MKSAYTLIEILIIFLILALLIVFSTVFAPVQIQKARDAVRKSHLDTIKKSINEFYTDKNCYPQTIPVCNNSLVNGNLVLLDKIPCDPLLRLSYTYVPEASECPKFFELYANLEYLNDKTIDKINCRQGCGPNCQFNYGVSSPNQNLDVYCNENNQENIPVLQYVCTPSGACEVYQDPEVSGCPDVYINDPTCQEACKPRENRCHDARGKMN